MLKLFVFEGVVTNSICTDIRQNGGTWRDRGLVRRPTGSCFGW